MYGSHYLVSYLGFHAHSVPEDRKDLSVSSYQVTMGTGFPFPLLAATIL
jgi:hypothetical protein